jgi:acetylornithine deacetylase
VSFANPPLGTTGAGAFAPWFPGLPGAAVDLQFWTEAALLSEAGIDAVVFGPGSISQAHAPDEHVEVAQLVQAYEAFLRVLA